jgi:hypothetical protein
MKMRIQGNAIRFRLNRVEVSQFETSGSVAGSIGFPGGGNLMYSLEKGGDALGATFDGGAIRVRIPEALAREWTGTDRVGINERAEGLEVTIEKDFQCLHKGEEGKDPNAYPNPMAGQAS